MTRSLNALGLIFLILVLGAGTLFLFLRGDPPVLYINEFMAENVTCCPDSTGGMIDHDDWIEIYNASKVPVDIGGMYFSQDAGQSLGHKIDDAHSDLTTIPPGGFLVLWADGSPEQGPLHLDFRLDQDGELLRFFDQHGRTIDSYTFTEQAHDVSLGRSTDGGSSWKSFSVPTPGAPNR